MPTASLVAILGMLSLAQPGGQPGEGVVNDDPAAEGKFLGEIRQLTFAEDFAKAGESYFSPAGRAVVFQAVPRPADGVDPDPHYGMYVALLQTEEGTVGLDSTSRLGLSVRISPNGSANTCGWFKPDTSELIFGSTVVPPSEDLQPGYQRGSSRYRWSFPTEMEIVQVDVGLRPFAITVKVVPEVDLEAKLVPSFPQVVFEKPGYTAECSYSPDGRHILYAQVDEAKSNEIGRPDADLWVFDTQTEAHVALVEAEGYDGGPFFSPDGKWICYRSDRKGDNLLQLFVAELAYDESGKITGISREIQLTDNEHVNWAPFWHPSGECLVYASSQVSHGNYEVFALAFDAAEPEKKNEPVRITYASGFDGLPVFSADGKWMMWTAQRGEDRGPDGKASSQLWMAEWKGFGGE